MLYFLLFIFNIAFAGQAIGIEGKVPAPPINKSPEMSYTARVLSVDDGDIPELLIPLKFTKNGKNVCRGKFYDEEGKVYRINEVLYILMKEPASRENGILAADKIQNGLLWQYVGASTIWAYGIGLPFYIVGWVIYSKGKEPCRSAIIDFNSRSKS